MKRITKKLTELSPYIALAMLILASLTFYLNFIHKPHTDELTMHINDENYDCSEMDFKNIRIAEFSDRGIEVERYLPIIINGKNALKDFEMSIQYYYNNLSIRPYGRMDTTDSRAGDLKVKNSVVRPDSPIFTPLTVLTDVDSLGEIHLYYQISYDGLEKPLFFYYDLFIDPLLGPGPINIEHSQHTLRYKKEFLRSIRNHYIDKKLILTMNDTTVLSTTEMLDDYTIDHFYSIQQLENDWSESRFSKYFLIFSACITIVLFSLLIYVEISTSDFSRFSVYYGFKVLLFIFFLLLVVMSGMLGSWVTNISR